MSARYDHGPLQTYEVIWRSGHVEQVQAHQVLWPHSSMFGDQQRDRDQRVLFHGEVEGRWLLILAVDVADIVSVRLQPSSVDR